MAIICYNLTYRCLVDENNRPPASRPELFFTQKSNWVFHFFQGELGTASPADLSRIVSWRAAVDCDYASGSTPMCRTSEGIDRSLAATGVITVPLDADTERFSAALGTAEKITALFELQGFDANGIALRVSFEINALNLLDAQGGEAPAATQNDLASKAWTKGQIALAPVFEYSTDGTSWHGTKTANDTFFRIRHGSSGTPSAALELSANGTVSGVNGGTGAVIISVNGQTTTDIELDAEDVGALSTSGGTVTGNIRQNSGNIVSFGGFTATNGGIRLDNGNLDVINGNITANVANLSVDSLLTQGKVTASDGIESYRDVVASGNLFVSGMTASNVPDIELAGATFTPKVLAHYQYTVENGATIYMNAPSSGKTIFDFDISIPAGTVSFSFAQSINWIDDVQFTPGTTAKCRFEFTGGTWQGGYKEHEMSQYAKLSGGTFTGDVYFGNSYINSTTLQVSKAGSMPGQIRAHSFAAHGNGGASGYWGFNFCSDNKSYAGQNSGTFGVGTQTNNGQFAAGKYNSYTTDHDKQQAFIIGGGTSYTDRRNAAEIDFSGNAFFAGNVIATVNGGTVSISDLLARIEALEEQ